MLDGAQPSSAGSDNKELLNPTHTTSRDSAPKAGEYNEDTIGFADPTADAALLGKKQPHTDSMASHASSRQASTFVQQTKFGVADPDEADEVLQELVQDKTPNTQRRVVKEESAKQVKKLGALATCFTIFKGFVATGILYVPKDFYNGGYIFTPFTLVGSLMVTLYCAKLLLITHERLNGGSFPEMGEKAYGKPGKLFVEIVLVASQFGFCTAYVYFIASQIGGIGGVIQCISSTLDDCSDGSATNPWIWMPICMAIYVPLVMVRKIEVFAATHVFGDVMIIITIIVIMGYASASLHNNGVQIDGVAPIGEYWADAIGFSVYTYEGIGVILPI